MFHNSFFSVVTPSFNQGRFIEKTIRSVLDQHHPYFEHIVIDGGSTDGTLNIFKKYPHLRWVSEPDKGKTHAVNKGFRMARGEIIAWINSDDYYADNTFARVASYFQNHPESRAVVGGSAVIDTSDKFLFYPKEPGPKGLTHRGMLHFWKHGTPPQSSLFFYREVFNEIGYLDEDIWSYMDYDFFLKLSRRYSLGRMNDILSYVRSHQDADTILNIACGILDDSLYRISRRYWGSAFSWEHALILLSYCVYLPRVRWNAYYERFAFDAKREMKSSYPKEKLWHFLWQSRRFFLKYPVAFVIAGIKKGLISGE